MAKTNTAELGFEKQIWKAADLLRGNMDASEYKSVVLGLIFLKYISDSFEAEVMSTINKILLILRKGLGNEVFPDWNPQSEFTSGEENSNAQGR